jgi:hypothetical protein
MNYNIGYTLREKTLQHADVKDRIASFEAFLDAHVREMQTAADNGREGIYINLSTRSDCITRPEADVVQMDQSELCAAARQFGLRIENWERLDGTGCYDQQSISFSLCWL